MLNPILSTDRSFGDLRYLVSAESLLGDAVEMPALVVEGLDEDVGDVRTIVLAPVTVPGIRAGTPRNAVCAAPRSMAVFSTLIR